jgi:PEGA domain-containing protein
MKLTEAACEVPYVIWGALRRENMMNIGRFSVFNVVSVALCALALEASKSSAQKRVMGEIQLVGATRVERTSGVWIDGQYVGYLRELKGSKKVTLLPGEHEIVVRQSGYKDFTAKVLVEPAQKQVVPVTMARDPRVQLPAVTAEVELSVTPNRAAVFLDDAFVGHVHEFGGLGRRMLVSPGKHRLKIALPGYQTFETEINLLPQQKFKIKTHLAKGSITQSGPLVTRR